MIQSFEHKGLQAFFERGTKAGITAVHAARLSRMLARLNVATSPDDMNLPGWKLHALTGKLSGYWAVSVSGAWRIVFTFEGPHAVHVDYVNYH